MLAYALTFALASLPGAGPTRATGAASGAGPTRSPGSTNGAGSTGFTGATGEASATIAARADAGSPGAQVVLALLERQRLAWNAGDLEGFCAIYADDARFLSPSGVTQGRAAVLARYQQRYPNKDAMGTLAFDVLEVREAAGAVSIAARWTLSFPGKAPASGHTLIVFNLLPAGWRLVQDASM